MKEKCIFCDIVDKKIPADVVYEDNEMLAFRDLDPQAPVHLLLIPKSHIESMDELSNKDVELLGKMLVRASALAGEYGLSERGYRVVVNCNSDAGQEVFHLHIHILGGRKFTWPPG